eukprot:g15947.t1
MAQDSAIEYLLALQARPRPRRIVCCYPGAFALCQSPEKCTCAEDCCAHMQARPPRFTQPRISVIQVPLQGMQHVQARTSIVQDGLWFAQSPPDSMIGFATRYFWSSEWSFLEPKCFVEGPSYATQSGIGEGCRAEGEREHAQGAGGHASGCNRFLSQIAPGRHNCENQSTSHFDLK